MKWTLFPCFLNSSTEACDNFGRYKNIQFEQIMPKFLINIDAKCPIDFKGGEIESENDYLSSIFQELEQKTGDYVKNFLVKYSKDDSISEYWSEGMFFEVKKEHGSVFFLVGSNLSTSTLMRFFISIS